MDADDRTQKAVWGYIKLLEPAMHAGRVMTPFTNFETIMEAASNPAAFSGDPDLGKTLLK
jgi:hypothetical protein